MFLMYYKEWEDRQLNSNFKPLQDTLFIAGFSITFLILRYRYLDKLVTRFYDVCGISENDKKKDKPSVLGSAVRLVMHTMFATYGLISLLTEDWIFSPFKTSLTWENNVIPVKIVIYYYLEAAFYVSSTLFIFIDPKQKDFMQMIVHHIIATALISLSYAYNILRYGSLIMIVHDLSDPFMELAKILFYLKYQKLAEFFFVCFAFVFATSRCIIFPFFIVVPAVTYTCLYGLNMSFLMMDLCMILLVILNYIWVTYIIQMVLQLVNEGTIKGDIRDVTDDKKLD